MHIVQIILLLCLDKKRYVHKNQILFYLGVAFKDPKGIFDFENCTRCGVGRQLGSIIQANINSFYCKPVHKTHIPELSVYRGWGQKARR